MPVDPASGLPSFADPLDEQNETFLGLGGALGSDPRRARPVHIVGYSVNSASHAAEVGRSTPLIPLVWQGGDPTPLLASEGGPSDRFLHSSSGNDALRPSHGLVSAAIGANAAERYEDRLAMLPLEVPSFGDALEDTLSL